MRMSKTELLPLSEIVIRPPANEAEVRMLFQLNHDVFSLELQQHDVHDDGLLIDKFHGKNDYLSAWRGTELVGMIAAHATPPFSAVERFGQPLTDAIGHEPIAEIRLFAVRPEYRRTLLAIKIGNAMFRRLVERGIPRAMISGIAEQRKLYEHLGFKVVGEPVSEGDNTFYPMIGQLAEMLDYYAKVSMRCEK